MGECIATVHEEQSHNESLGQALQNSWDRPFKILGTGPLLGQALRNYWDKPALGTGSSKFLGQARSWDRLLVCHDV